MVKFHNNQMLYILTKFFPAQFFQTRFQDQVGSSLAGILYVHILNQYWRAPSGPWGSLMLSSRRRFSVMNALGTRFCGLMRLGLTLLTETILGILCDR